jgi:hypothetical protein
MKAPRAGVEYVPSPRIAFREIEGQILLLLPNDPEIYTFNAAAAVIWKGLIRQHDPARIAADLARAFDVDARRAASDVEKFIRDMRRKGLLTRRVGQ